MITYPKLVKKLKAIKKMGYIKTHRTRDYRKKIKI